MLKKLFALVACLLIFHPVLSLGFDCNKPEFGASLNSLDKEGYFVKYMEKDGVSYYNYTGPCRMPMHSLENPAISFAFIDDQLFAIIVRTSGVDLETAHANFEERMSEVMNSSHFKKTQTGDLLLYQWINEKDHTKLKIKINTKTSEQKGVRYYEPLREKLKNKMQSLDPVDEME